MSWLHHGTLLDLVQRTGVFPRDSKTFPDMSVRTASVAEVLSAWEALESSFAGHDAETKAMRVKSFVLQHFQEPGCDMHAASLPPPRPGRGPSFLQSVQPAEVAAFGREVCGLWSQLYRQVSADVIARPQNHSMLPLPHPFIIPGDRFREVYYWDSYWVSELPVLRE